MAQPFGPYELLKPLGTGGMGVVWQAIERQSGRQVALKQLYPALLSDAATRSRFFQEAQLAAQISDSHVTFVFEAGEVDRQPYIAMELMDGQTVAQLIEKEGPLPIQRAVDIILQAIDGMIAAHRIGVVHRDIKPSNLFLDHDSQVKVGDFGLSKSMGGKAAELTQLGSFMGTPLYASPEQLRCAAVDHRTDIYSLGATLFTLLAGQPPFQGDSMSVAAQIISDPAPLLRTRQPQIPRDLERIVDRCLAKTAGDRFPDLTHLRTALLPFASHGTTLATAGRRLAAFMLDYFTIQLGVKSLLAVAVIGILVQSYLELQFQSLPSAFARLTWIYIVGFWSSLVAYFALSEGLTGLTLGKRMLGLRVVNDQGESPGLGRGFLRAVVVPGCFGITLICELMLLRGDDNLFDTAGRLFSDSVSTIVFVLIVTACLTSMRASNGLRGVHEWLSRTRVFYVVPGRCRKLKLSADSPYEISPMTLTFGPFQTTKLLAQSDAGDVFLASDPQLSREVWIVRQPHQPCPDVQRINLKRPSRTRWLGGGSADHGRWDAYEAVRGMPIHILLANPTLVDWSVLRMVLQDVAMELQAATVDETLPAELSLTHIWVDEFGHAKVVDQSLVKGVRVGQYDQFELRGVQDRVANYGRLLQELAELVRQNYPGLPRSAKEFLIELSQQPADVNLFEFAIQRLKSMSQRMAVLGWDARAGILGVTLGVEKVTLSLLSSLVFLTGIYLVPESDFFIRFGLCWFIMVSIVAIVGFVFRGGPVFHYMNINVCDLNGRLASRARAAWRNVLAWSPALYLQGATIVGWLVTSEYIKQMHTLPSSLLTQLQSAPLQSAELAISSFCCLGLIGYGIYFLLKHPTRGLQDWLAGTQLIPE